MSEQQGLKMKSCEIEHTLSNRLAVADSSSSLVLRQYDTINFIGSIC